MSLKNAFIVSVAPLLLMLHILFCSSLIFVKHLLLLLALGQCLALKEEI